MGVERIQQRAQHLALRGPGVEGEGRQHLTSTTCGLLVRKLRIHLQREGCRSKSHNLWACLKGTIV